METLTLQGGYQLRKLHGERARQARLAAIHSWAGDPEDGGKILPVTLSAWWPEPVAEPCGSLEGAAEDCHRYAPGVPCALVELKRDGTPHMGRAPWLVVQ